MTVPGALVRLLAIVVFAAALPCRGEEAISGRWEGTTHIPDDDLNVIVDLGQENGEATAKTTIASNRGSTPGTVINSAAANCLIAAGV